MLKTIGKILVFVIFSSLVAFIGFRAGERINWGAADIELDVVRRQYNIELDNLRRSLAEVTRRMADVRADLDRANDSAGKIRDWYRRVTFLLNEYARATGNLEIVVGQGNTSPASGGAIPR